MSGTTFTSLALVALAAVARVNGHFFIKSPAPITDSAPKDPLDPSGSDFPCHGAALPSSGGEKMAAGSSQILSFELGGGANTAVHGGGSCQMSITYETDSTKLKDPENWKVIYSIEGGCPSNTQGNLPTAVDCDTTGDLDCVNSYNFSIPEGVKEGHAIMAWTWFNTIGNREMYMNCINADITGGDGSEMDGLPSMFAANVASVTDCTTSESTNVKFPDPGEYTYEGESQYDTTEPEDAACAASYSDDSGDSGSASSSAAASTPSAYADQTSAPSSPAASSAPSTPSTAPAYSSASVQPVESVTVSSQPTASYNAVVPSAKASVSAPTNGSCPNGSVSCSSPGEMVCDGKSSFGICDQDMCAVVVSVAPGTECSNGAISKRSHVVRRHIARRRIGDHV